MIPVLCLLLCLCRCSEKLVGGRFEANGDITVLHGSLGNESTEAFYGFVMIGKNRKEWIATGGKGEFHPYFGFHICVL